MGMSGRLRTSLMIVGGIMLAALLAAVLVAFLLLRPARFTQTLRNAANGAGLQLTVSAPAHPTLWPRPGVQLDGLQLFVKGQSRPLLIASHAHMVVPWRTLFGGPTAITVLDLDSPRLDLEQLQNALANLSAGTSGAPALPHIDTGVQINDGSVVRGDQVWLEKTTLRTNALSKGKAFSINLSGQLASGQPVTLHARLTPRDSDDKAITFRDMHINASSGADKTTRLHLSGRALWRGGSKFESVLAGELVLPNKHSYQVQLGSAPQSTGESALRLHLVLDGPAGHVDMHAAPGALAAWWQRVVGDHAPAPLPELPVDGHLDASTLNLGNVHIEGLKIRSGDAVPARSSSTSSTPAKTAK